MKVIIAGSRTFEDGKLGLKLMLQSGIPITEIVCGKARGADTIGETWGKYLGIPIKEFPADWDAYGKKAGFLRNEQMAEYADALIAFWDGKSKGTESMIKLATKYNLLVKVFEV